jgi:hypothetical protein
MTVAPGSANAGTIRIESVGNAFLSQLVIPSGGVFTNLATGRLESRPGAGGPRAIAGAAGLFVNEGILNPGYPNHLTIQGDFTQTTTGLFETEYAGPAPASHSRLNVSGTATLAGTIDLKLTGGYVPGPGVPHESLAAGSRVGTFVNSTSCEQVSIEYTATSVRAFFAFSDVLGDLDGNGLVNAVDLSILLGAWGTDNCRADLNQNGTVDASDLAILLAAWS